MNKIISLVLFIVIAFSDASNAHVQHYANLNEIKFEIFRNDSKVGYHNIIFSRDKGILTVNNEIEFDIKKLGISFYKYQSKGTEVYDQEGLLFSFNSQTSDNEKIKFCDIKKDKNKKYLINGTHYQGIFEENFVISSYWNHEILKKHTQISGITCRVKKQKVSFVKDEIIKINGASTATSIFDIQGKYLNTQIWYRKSDMAIMKQILNQKGIWRYDLSKIN
jgi:hypothetical protein|tara:strand:- start:160 stop:822 length:663 start_codon:yes stop_codon:yes gene_type:complete